jgi:integrase
MKMRDTHIVPLSRQAIEIFRTIQPLTGRDRYVFPSLRSRDRPISENTVNVALRRIGYSKEEMTGHGFRSMASTILHENGWAHDVIERQLAHAERNSVSAAYNYAQHLAERKEMMQWWADHLETLEKGALILPVNFRKF